MFHGLGQMDLSGLRPLPRRVGQWCRRRRSRLVFAVLCLSLLLVLRAVLKLRPSRESIEMAGTVNELMKLPPKGYVNLGVAALSLAKEHYRDLDVAAADRQIDGLAFRIKSLAEDLKGRGVADPETTAMNRVLFEEEGFKYDMVSLKRRTTDPGYLSYLLDTHQGDCLSMTTLCLVIAQRLGWYVYPVSAPGHVFLRYVSPDKTREYNIEPTAGGETLPDEFYTQNLSISANSYERGTYLRPLRDREFLALLLNLSTAGLPPKQAIQRLKKALELDPRCADCYMQLAGVYHMESIMTRGKESLWWGDEAIEYKKKAEEMGWVALEDTPLWKRRISK